MIDEGHQTLDLYKAFLRGSTCGIDNDSWKVKSMARRFHDPFMSSILTEATQSP